MTTVPVQATVTSAELVRQFGRWQDHAASQPVVVTHHGRDRVVLLSTVHYQQLIGERSHTAAGPSDGRGEAVDQLTEHLTDGFIAFRPDLTISAINRAACCFLKAQRGEVLGRRLDERLPGIEETLGYASLVRAMKAGGLAMLEMPSFAYEGRWLLFQTFPLGDGAACLFRDITDDLHARRQADAKAATLAALAVHGSVGRAKLSARGTFTEVDPAFASLAGFGPDGLARARLTDIFAIRWRSDAAEQIEAVLQGGPPRQLDVTLLTKDGQERPARVGLAALRDRDGTSGAVVVMTQRP